MDACHTKSKKVSEDEQEIPMKEAPHKATKAKDTKEVSLGLADPAKTMKIGANLDPK